MDQKAFSRVELKNSDQGLVSAVFASYDVKDHDGDVTLKGAFEEGAAVRVSAFNHGSWKGALPVGKGRIRSTESEAICDMEFFMNTTHGRDTFETIKQMGELQELSYGFDIVDSEPGDHDGEKVRFLKQMRVHEVSPVLLGAGVGTRVLSVKSDQKVKFSEHGEAVLADLTEFRSRAAEVLAMRREKGSELGGESKELLGKVREELKALDELLEPPVDTRSAEIAAEMLQIWRRSLANFEEE